MLGCVLSQSSAPGHLPPRSSHKPHGMWMKWDNGAETFFHARWLWHNSSQFVHPGTGQKLLPPWAMPLRPELASVSPVTSEHGRAAVRMVWADGSDSEFDVDWLRAHDYSEASLAHRAQRAAGNLPPTAAGPLAGAGLQDVTPGELSMHQAPVVDWDAVKALYPSRVPAGTPLCSPVPEAGRTGHLPLAGVRDMPPQAESGPPVSHRVQAAHSQVPEVQFSAVRDSKAALLSALTDLNREGAVLIRGVPCEEGAVAELAELVAPVMSTIYGRLFDVRAQADPINLAYSQYGLELHQDLAYYESPPGVQLLHCREFDASISGGESTLIDAMHVAEEFRTTCPAAFHLLATVPATFQKVHYAREQPVHMVFQRPHIATASVTPMMTPLPAGAHGAVTCVSWAPLFEGPLAVHPAIVEAYYEAYVAFSRVLKARERFVNTGPPSSGCFTQFKLTPGDCIVFNNRRMLHGRLAFGDMAGGAATARHLQGCYLNIDEYKSALCHLTAAEALAAEQVSPSHPLAHMDPAAHDVVVKRVGNQCMT